MNTFRKGALALGLAAALPFGAAAQTFTYGSFVPATEFTNTNTLPETFKKIEDETGGKVKWNLVVGGQLANGVTTFSSIADRLIDGGLIAPFFSPSSMPAISFLYTIVVPTDDEVALSGAAVETLFLDCPECLASARNINSIPFGAFAAPPVLLMCTGPVKTLDDLKKMRVRANGGIGDELSAAGATVVAMTLADSVTALQRGGIDCVVGAAEWLKTYGYGDKAKYVLSEPLGMYAPVMGLEMNRDAYNEMDETGKKATIKAAAYLTARHAISNYIVRTNEVLQEQIADNGVQIVESAPDLADFIRGFPAANREDRIAAGKALGVADPEALMAAYARNLEKWTELSKEIGTDVDAFEKALWDEVYSKVDPDSL